MIDLHLDSDISPISPVIFTAVVKYLEILPKFSLWWAVVSKRSHLYPKPTLEAQMTSISTF